MTAAFLPSVNGFAFGNDWPSAPILKFTLPVWGDVDVGDASLGLCGGMTLSALDYFLAGKLPPDSADQPPPDAELHRFLVGRQIDSLSLPHGGLRVWRWTASPDAALLRWSRDEADWLVMGLDARPVPLMLIRGHSVDPRVMSRNHQVLSYGVSGDGVTTTIRVCDPNEPRDDSVTVTIDPDGVRHRDYPLRGFYVNQRPPAEPPA